MVAGESRQELSPAGETLLSVEGRGISSDRSLAKGIVAEREAPREWGIPQPFVAPEPVQPAERVLWELDVPLVMPASEGYPFS